MWYETQNNVCLFVPLLLRASLLVVVIWSDMLGGVQWWESPLPRDAPQGSCSTAREWIQDGEANERSMHR